MMILSQRGLICPATHQVCSSPAPPAPSQSQDEKMEATSKLLVIFCHIYRKTHLLWELEEIRTYVLSFFVRTVVNDDGQTDRQTDTHTHRKVITVFRTNCRREPFGAHKRPQ